VSPLASSGDPLVAVGEDLSILAWNEAAVSLTGLAACDVLGSSCFLAIAGVTPDGTPICGPGCPLARDAFAERPVCHLSCRVRARAGSKAVALSTIRVATDARTFLVHLLLEEPLHAISPSETPETPALSARQREVLGLLADGVRAQAIADRLGLSETTVRNHIRAILARLGCHSQLEAVVEARRRGLLSE
jgi:DNA-binding CsgD family transcriptional regulator